jgi:uncharacterized protein
VVYNFPKTKLVDGPLQIEARIDQNAQLSGQLTLWNQQGSLVRRGALLVIPTGRALLYAKPIYLQAERSPMPELRLVVLALRDRLAYGPTFESAMAALFGGAVSSLTAVAVPPEPVRGATASPALPQPEAALNALIVEAAKDLADYQRLTAEGKLGEAGQKLEELKRALEQTECAQEIDSLRRHALGSRSLQERRNSCKARSYFSCSTDIYLCWGDACASPKFCPS